MDDFERLERKREARRRLAAQRGRAGRLRGRVVAGSLVCFVLLWGIVFGQMVTGNDPVLAPKAERAAQVKASAKVARVRPSAAPVEAEVAVEPELQAEPEPEVEPEPEPLTTGQS